MSSPFQPGQRLGPYEITAEAGEGGMGLVFKAKDFQLGREVALEVLPEGFTADPERLAHGSLPRAGALAGPGAGRLGPPAGQP